MGVCGCVWVGVGVCVGVSVCVCVCVCVLVSTAWLCCSQCSALHSDTSGGCTNKVRTCTFKGLSHHDFVHKHMPHELKSMFLVNSKGMDP